MLVYLYPSALELVHEHCHRWLVVVSGYYYAVDFKLVSPEVIDKPEDIHVVGYPEISPYLVSLNISRIDADDYLYLFLKPVQKLYLCILVKSRQHSFCVHVKHELSSEFKVKLVIVVYSLEYVFGLFLQILSMIKSDFHISSSLNQTVQAKFYPPELIYRNIMVSV